MAPTANEPVPAEPAEAAAEPGVDGGERAGYPRTLLARVLSFARRVLRGFDHNGGFVLAGAMAYSALLSVVPLALLLTALLSAFADPVLVMTAVQRSLGRVLVAGQAELLVDAVGSLVGSAEIGGVFGAAGLLFFATTGFRVMQAAFAQIFRHRLADRRARGLLRSMLMSIGFIGALGILLLLRIELGTFRNVSSLLNLAGGFLSLVLVMGGIYRVVPVGGLPWRPALTAGAVVAALWELLVQLLGWYFGSFSQVNLVYGSMGAVVLILITVEYAAAIVLIGAQVIAEVEQSRAAGLPWYERAPVDSR